MQRIHNKKTAERLQKAFRACGLLQAELAENSRINQSQVSRLLNGRFERRTKGLDALCMYLKVKPVFRNDVMSLSGYPHLASCLSEVLDGSKKRELAVVRLLKSATRLS